MLASPLALLPLPDQPLSSDGVASSSHCSYPATMRSCGMDAEIKFRSFGWSDMPCQGDYFLSSEEDLHRLATSLSDLSLSTYSLPSSPPSLATPPPSPTSTVQIASLDGTCQKTEKKKKVSFEPALEVRTYELILGDHPCCRGGMALECGWKYADTELVDMETHEQVHAIRKSIHEMHMSFYARRQRLQDVTGMTGPELLQAEYAMQSDEASHESHRFHTQQRTLPRCGPFRSLEANI